MRTISAPVPTHAVPGARVDCGLAGMPAHVNLMRPDPDVRNAGSTRTGGEGRASGGHRRDRQTSGGQRGSGEKDDAAHANLRFFGSADLGRPGGTSQHPG